MKTTKIYLLAVLFTLQTVWADFRFNNFSDTSGLTINGQAHVVNVEGSDRMRLVNSGATWAGGSIFYNDLQQISEFHTSFCFRINELGGITDSLNPDSGADGLALVIQSSYGPAFIEHTGGGQGYEGAVNTLAIEFDCWNNGSAYNEPSRSHVGVMVDGIIDHSYALATADWGDMDMSTPPPPPR